MTFSPIGIHPAAVCIIISGLGAFIILLYLLADAVERLYHIDLPKEPRMLLNEKEIFSVIYASPHPLTIREIHLGLVKARISSSELTTYAYEVAKSLDYDVRETLFKMAADGKIVFDSDKVLTREFAHGSAR